MFTLPMIPSTQAPKGSRSFKVLRRVGNRITDQPNPIQNKTAALSWSCAEYELKGNGEQTHSSAREGRGKVRENEETWIKHMSARPSAGINQNISIELTGAMFIYVSLGLVLYYKIEHGLLFKITLI